VGGTVGYKGEGIRERPYKEVAHVYVNIGFKNSREKGSVVGFGIGTQNTGSHKWVPLPTGIGTGWDEPWWEWDGIGTNLGRSGTDWDRILRHWDPMGLGHDWDPLWMRPTQCTFVRKLRKHYI